MHSLTPVVGPQWWYAPSHLRKGSVPCQEFENAFILDNKIDTGVQLILAYSWTRPAILAAGKDVGGGGECFYFSCFFAFIPVPLSSLSLSFVSPTVPSISFLPFSGR